MTSEAVERSLLIASFQRCRSRVVAFIRRRTSVREDADDIVQEISWQLFRVEHPVENVAAWLFRAARNELIDRGRKRQEVPLSGLLTQDDERDFPDEELADTLFGVAQTPEEEYLKSLFWKELEDALSELPRAQRQVFEKTELQGLSYKEIADETGDSVQALLSRKHKAVIYLRSRLCDLYNSLTETEY